MIENMLPEMPPFTGLRHGVMGALSKVEGVHLGLVLKIVKVSGLLYLRRSHVFVPSDGSGVPRPVFRKCPLPSRYAAELQVS